MTHNKISWCFYFLDLTYGKLTVGKIYVGLLILDNWRAYKASQTKFNSMKLVSIPYYCYDL